MKTLQQHNMAMQPPTMDKLTSFQIRRENKISSYDFFKRFENLSVYISLYLQVPT